MKDPNPLEEMRGVLIDFGSKCWFDGKSRTPSDDKQLTEALSKLSSLMGEARIEELKKLSLPDKPKHKLPFGLHRSNDYIDGYMNAKRHFQFVVNSRLKALRSDDNDTLV